MKKLRIDLETYSSVDLKKCGVYRYSEARDFQVLLFGYKWIETGFNPTPSRALEWVHYDRDTMRAYAKRCLDPLDDLDGVDRQLLARVPPHLIQALVDPTVVKIAFNASFERVCLSALLGIYLDPAQWRCTMVKSLYCGLPGDLARVGQVLRARVQKDRVGFSLIRYFCMPCKPTKKNGMRTRNMPWHDPEKWELFKQYNCTDIDSEEAIDERVSKIEMPEIEWRAYAQDQRMNDRGIPVNKRLVEAAIKVGNEAKLRLNGEIKRITGVTNANSVKQLVAWLNEEIPEFRPGVPAVSSLNKKTIPLLQNMVDPDSKAERLLQLRTRVAKASVAKYDAALRSICSDNRLRGAGQFYGANRTGRWAARLVQYQNMIKTDYSLLPDLDAAREVLINTADYDVIERLWDDPMMVLAQLTRSMFECTDGRQFCPIDFKAIEARALAWKAKEKWRLDVFNGDGRIYEASAARMFKIPLSSITKGSPYRAKGKVAELALGYGGGEGALVNMGALEMGIPYQDLDPLKVLWRQENQRIVKLWWDVGDAAMACVRTGKRQDVHGIGFRMHLNCLLMRLDSGRELVYVKPRIEEGNFGDEVTYEGMDQTTKQWVRINSYGPKWIENWDQAFCRDLLRDKLLMMEEQGLDEYIDFTVHDEVVPEIDDPNIKGKLEKIFSAPVSWAPGMPLAGDAYLTPYYIKEDD